MNNLLHKQLIVLIAVLSFISGMSSLAWCQHYGAESGNHVMTDRSEHGDAHNHQHMASGQSISEASCREHSHDCVHISFSPQTLTSNHTVSIAQRIINSCQPVPFQNTGLDIYLTVSNRPLRSPSMAVPPDNIQLASLQTVVLRN